MTDDNHLNFRVLLTVFTIVTLGLYLYPTKVNALTLSPTRFEIRGNPGDTLNEEMLITNETETAEIYYSSFSNFEAQGDSGSPAFVEPKEGLGTWITTGAASIDVAPRQQKIVSFKVDIPKDAEPGGYFAVIFWGTSPAGQGQVSIGAKTGILVLLSVNGEVREEAGLLNFNTIDSKFWYNTLPVSFEYRFKNDGGDRIKPQGTIKIRDTIFLPTETLDANPVEGNVLPGSTRKIKVDWIKYERPVDFVEPTGIFAKFWSDTYYQWKNFAVGLYSANLNVSYGLQEQQVKKTVFFFVFPWQLVLVMVLLFIIIFWSGKKLIKRYNRFIIERARAGINLPPNSLHG
ncbi:hypothetical protein A2911_00405 [Candidatus Nomurabacteria bacterium RIFCSPLOWO2_01_FULL_40_15]|uniref:Uncharacterized protein n=1 Tax=Candidatus Nomurabacteria bacterium RIFCSPLOWO2_01_FULL_40_15 TaxID=1801772 RepID=A0A1F6X8P8_9BACT|nr:MAG: hypothetical protein A2911_00405 [Candidatus Nomurabacteria bacterium RIFCSPLOWO2_01_FULL_40_15]